MSEDLKITFPASPYCEHCGDMPPGSCQIVVDDGPAWCIDCADGVTDIDYDALLAQEKIEERKHLQARIDEIDGKTS